ncbi:hypothetical protein [Ferruginibacter sp. HRS2-29]|uniref:hypothetical protein n=1 Tax=Ferruginibacter sp. HRS2-29 TaxID=2487334 RepID=UPI0020CCE33E|nr:hypothetical protein [Ferruginibacter sp. HRS2-29]MCP9750203.1 hypothetical protein [Ferruginibacter sp. HRS2-29]MCP9752384.1 hypothetical protein [Ferruginibacter sp. HRS2-29]
MNIYPQRICTLKEAYEAIHEFFSCYHCPEAREEVAQLFEWACKEKYYKGAPPVNIVFLAQQLHRLFSAAEIISYSLGRKFSAVLTPEVWPQPPGFAHGCPFSNEKSDSSWECFPRHLTAEEYLNPYFALEKINHIPQWEQVLQELMEAALSKGSIDGWYSIGEVMQWKERMMGVVEGGWLVEERIA